MIIYVAGPMSGLPEHNYPAFCEAAVALRDLGFEVLNPVDAEKDNLTGTHQSWDWYMRKAIRMVSRADAIAFLPGWANSRGARLEHQIGAGLKLRMRTIEHWLADPADTLDDDLTGVNPDDFHATTPEIICAIERVRANHRRTIEGVLARRAALAE